MRYSAYSHGDQTGTVALYVPTQGGGVPAEDQKLIFNYGFTTARHRKASGKASVAAEIGGLGALGAPDLFPQETGESPMAGLGFGLPLSRLYTEYFGGKLDMTVMHGYGTDVYVHLNSTGQQMERVAI